MKKIIHENKNIYFVSTAHVSKESVIEVKETIDTVQPDAICIELDDNRAQAMKTRDQQSDIDIKAIIKNKKVASFVANLILSSYQKRLADDLDTSVGQEMIQAMESAQEVGASIHYIDRDIQITFNRIWGNLSFWKKINIAVTLIMSLFSSDDVEVDDIEQLKQSDLLYEAVKEMDDKLPEVSQQLLHERNYYMAEKIKTTPGENIVVVIGAAHTQGIIEALNENHSIHELNKTPEKKKHSWAGWIIPGILLAMIIILTLRSPSVGLRQLIVWLGLSAGMATIGAVLVGAHPLTILTTLVSAPIGTLSPFLAVGFFAGLMEAYQRPPKVSDFDALSEDIVKPKMWFKNRVLRVLLVLLVTNILSSLGTFIAGGNIIAKLFNF